MNHPPDQSRLDVPVELSDEIQLPQTGENLPQIQSQKCSWIWYVIHTLTYFVCNCAYSKTTMVPIKVYYSQHISWSYK